jgi:opacity protein-like surface antigen
MKLKMLVSVTSALLLTSGMAKAVHVWEDPGGWSSGVFSYEASNASKFTANELSLDLSGSYIAAQRHLGDLFDTNIRHGRWGGSVGLNYFFTRYVGLGGDINISDNNGHNGNFVDQAIGNLILRWPLDPSGFAPYVFGGGGRGFDNPVPTSDGNKYEWLGDLGVGMEYRLNLATGIFADGRYIWGDQTGDRLLLRAGLRIVF